MAMILEGGRLARVQTVPVGVTRAVVPIRERIGPQLAWVLAGSAFVFEVVQVGLLVGRNGMASDTLARLLLVMLPVCGALVVNQQPTNRMGWILLVAGVAGIVGSAIDGARVVALGPTTPSPWFGLLGDIAWPLGAPLLFATLLLIFPSGYPPSKWVVPFRLGVVGVGLLMVSAATIPWGDNDHGGLANPIDVLPSTLGLGAHHLGLALVAVAGIAGIAHGITLYRTGSPVEKAQLRMVVTFAVAALALIAAAAVAAAVAPLPSWVESSLPATVVLGFPVAIAAAVLRERLFDHTVIVNRAAVVFASRVGAAAVVVGIAAIALREAAPDHDIWWFIGGALGTLAAVQASRWLAGGLNRRFFGTSIDPLRALTTIPTTSRLVDATVVREWAEVVRDATRVPFVHLDLGPGLVVRVGNDVTLPVRTVQVEINDDCVGELIVAHRSPSDLFTVDDERLLQALAGQIGRSVEFAVIAQQARTAQAQLSATVDRERERLHRDLHDQLGPRLAGVTYLLAAVESQHGTGPLDTARAELLEAVNDVRRIAHDLRPQPVQQHGLAEAIRRHAQSWSDATGIQLNATIEEINDLDITVATAVYTVALEAITNVERHARATHCRVALHGTPDVVSLEINDDGIGVDAHPIGGIGLASMRSRAAALNGAMTIDGTHGTSVRLEIPRHG